MEIVNLEKLREERKWLVNKKDRLSKKGNSLATESKKLLKALKYDSIDKINIHINELQVELVEVLERIQEIDGIFDSVEKDGNN